MVRVLALDVGATSCRGALFVDDARSAEAAVDGVGGVAGRGGPAAVRDAMLAVAAEVRVGRVDAVCAGIAGLAQARQRELVAEDLALALAEHLGARDVALTSDMTTSHAGALGGGPGVVVAAGTGAVALAVDDRGRSAMRDGWGHLLGDRGSGFQVGREGLAEALAEHEGRSGSAALRRLAQQRYGDLDRLPGTVLAAANPARLVAAFAPDVLRAADDGDERAVAIWDRAGRDLARTAAAAARQLVGHGATFDVATTGGLFDAGPRLLDPFCERLRLEAPGARLVERHGDAVAGAHLLVTRHDLPHETLVLRPLAGREVDQPA